MQIGVVLNPSSRGNRRHPDRGRDLLALAGAGASLCRAQTLEPLREFLQDWLGRTHGEPRALAICGGDGTQHVVLSQLAGLLDEGCAWPDLVPLRGGTMNTVASSVGVPRLAPEVLLQRFVSRAADGRTRRRSRRLARVGERVGFLFGVGAVHGFLSVYYQGGDPNPVHAATTLGKAAFGALLGRGAIYEQVVAPFRGSVQFANGPSWEERDYLAITGGTIDDIGLGFRPFPRTRESADGFQLLGITARPAQMTRALPRVLLGKSMGAGVAFDTLGEHAVIHPADDAPYGTMIDGDLYEQHGPLPIRSGPMVDFLY